MRPAQKRGVTRSGIMHFLMLMLAIFGLPHLLDRSRIEEPSAITVEILPVTGITNVKPQEAEPEPKPEEKPAEPPKPQPPVQAQKEPEKPQPKVVDQAPPPPEPKPEPKPEEKKEEEKPKEPEKKPEEKKAEEKKPDKKPKPEDDLMAVLKSVKETAKKQESDEKQPSEEDKSDGAKKALSNQYNPTQPLSMSEKDAVRSQISKCWNVPAGAKDAHELIVVLRVQLEQDGTVINVELADESKSRYASDTFFRAAADSALRAVRQCSPLQNLPPDKFSTWRDMELTFDPKEMLF